MDYLYSVVLMLNDSIGFDQEKSRTYEAAVRQMIAGYDLLHRMTETVLAAELSADASLLIAGCGSGNEIAQWGAQHAGWSFTGVDPSAPMIALAEEKIKSAGMSTRVQLKTTTVDKLPDGAAFDAATLLLVLHFIPDAAKIDLLNALFDRLKPGALFILASRFGDPETTRFKKMIALSKAWALAQGMEAKEAQERFSATRKDLHDVPEERIKNLLREAGFIDIQRFYQAFIVGGWLARKPF